MNTAKVIVGVLAGVAVGAAIGILFSPDKGANTRKKLTKKSDDIMRDIKEGLSEIYDTVAQKYGAASNEVEKLVKNGKSKLVKKVQKIEN
jgi:gas vesicle protein